MGGNRATRPHELQSINSDDAQFVGINASSKTGFPVIPLVLIAGGVIAVLKPLQVGVTGMRRTFSRDGADDLPEIQGRSEVAAV